MTIQIGPLINGKNQFFIGVIIIIKQREIFSSLKHTALNQ